MATDITPITQTINCGECGQQAQRTIGIYHQQGEAPSINLDFLAHDPIECEDCGTSTCLGDPYTV